MRCRRRVTSSLTAVSIAIVLLAACAPSPPAAAPAPTPAPGASCALGAPAPAPGAAPYAFFDATGGCPVRWNPCASVPYWVNTTGSPLPLTALQGDVAVLAAGTGLTFAYQGSSTQSVPTWSGPGLLIGFATAATEPAFSHGAIGVTYTTYSGHRILTAGVDLKQDWVANTPQWHALLLHELGHAVGLDHVSDVTQLMNPFVTSTTTYAAGDSEGLRLVGRTQGCIPVSASAATVPQRAVREVRSASSG